MKDVRVTSVSGGKADCSTLLPVNDAKAIYQQCLIKVLHIAVHARGVILCSVGNRYGGNALFFPPDDSHLLSGKKKNNPTTKCCISLEERQGPHTFLNNVLCNL